MPMAPLSWTPTITHTLEKLIEARRLNIEIYMTAMAWLNNPSERE